MKRLYSAYVIAQDNKYYLDDDAKYHNSIYNASVYETWEEANREQDYDMFAVKKIQITVPFDELPTSYYENKGKLYGITDDDIGTGKPLKRVFIIDGVLQTLPSITGIDIGGRGDINE